MSQGAKYDLLRFIRLRSDITVRTKDELFGIKTYQRKWGMLVGVYDEEPGIYELSYGFSSTVISDNLNWKNITPVRANGIISGGIFIWLGGLNFELIPTHYVIGNKDYSLPSEPFSSNTADPTHPRFDLPVLTFDEDGAKLIVKEGTPAENPAVPGYDPQTELPLSPILIPAGSPIPDVALGTIYDENLPGEWTPAAVGTTIDPDNEENPLTGSKALKVTNISNNDTINFTSPAPVALGDWDTLIVPVALKQAMINRENIYVEFLLDGTSVTGQLLLNINKSITTYQSLAVSLSEFLATGPVVNALRIRWSRSGGDANHPGFFLDNVRLQGGIAPPPVQGNVKLTGEVLAEGPLGQAIPAKVNEGDVSSTLGDEDTLLVRIEKVLRSISWGSLKTILNTLYVALTGDQTISGTKTFSSFPVTPSAAPSSDYQVANKKYVDDNAAGGGIPEAPEDGKTYGRKDAAWAEVTGGGGGTAAPEYNPIPAILYYADGKVKQVKTDIGGGLFIDKRVAYHDSGDNIGKADYAEIKDERTDPALWKKIQYNYTEKVLTSTTVTDIVAWTIII